MGIAGKKEWQTLVKMMLPILVAQLSTVGMTFINTLMAGHAGSADLAGVSVGAGLFYPFLAASVGLLMAGTPMIAQLLGEGKREAISSVVRSGLYIAVLLSLSVGALYWIGADFLMAGMGLDESVEHIARVYLLCMVGTLFFLSLIIPLRALTDTVSGPSVSMKLFLTALPLNGLLNYMFVFGEFGMPRLGGIGSGVAMMTTYGVILCLFLLLVGTDKTLCGKKILSSWTVGKKELAEYLSIGIPCGLSVFVEMSLFSAIVFLMARFGTEALAAFQVADNFANLVYMAPVSCAMALTILTASSVGAQDCDAARRYRTAGLILSSVCALATVALTAWLRDEIASVYTADSKVILLSGEFLLFAAGWQFFDAIAVPVQGILRGYKDTRISFLYMLVAYWAICMPIGLLLDYGFGMGANSYWLGLDFGVACAAMLLLRRLAFVEYEVAGETFVSEAALVWLGMIRKPFGDIPLFTADEWREVKENFVFAAEEAKEELWTRYQEACDNADVLTEKKPVLEICWSVLTDLHLCTVGRATRAYVP